MSKGSMGLFRLRLQNLRPILTFVIVPSCPTSRGGGVSAALSSTDQSHVLVNRPPPRQVVSLLTCSKLCAISFVVGVVFGFTLKQRVKRWASNILKRLKDN
nr:hypothetical protein CFP56_36991 [Quercus suber]